MMRGVPTFSPLQERRHAIPLTSVRPLLVCVGCGHKAKNVEISAERAEIRKVKLLNHDGKPGRETGPYLVIPVTVRNTTADRKLDYTGSAVLGASFRFRLTDDRGNQYHLASFGFPTRAEGQAGNDTLYPGKSVVDVLIFEKPVSAARTLHLTIDAVEGNIPVVVTAECPKT